MAKSVYLGDGNSHKVKKMYEGNGTAQKIKKGYIGDSSGKARLFFSSGYRWERYNIKTEYRWGRYTISYHKSYAGTIYDRFTAESTNQYYMNKQPEIVNGKFVFSNYGVTNFYEGLSVVVSESQYWQFEGPNSNYVYTNTNGVIEYVGNNTYELSRRTPTDPSPSATMYIVGTTPGTLIDYVYSTNKSTYPTNGASGNYYYLYIDYDQSKGSYIDIIEAEDENAYPDNGISGNYWYVKIQE